MVCIFGALYGHFSSFLHLKVVPTSTEREIKIGLAIKLRDYSEQNVRLLLKRAVEKNDGHMAQDARKKKES